MQFFILALALVRSCVSGAIGAFRRGEYNIRASFYLLGRLWVFPLGDKSYPKTILYCFRYAAPLQICPVIVALCFFKKLCVVCLWLCGALCCALLRFSLLSAIITLALFNAVIRRFCACMVYMLYKQVQRILNLSESRG